MFGPVGTLRRTYYYSKETRHGHYPLDERLGLVGRYTSALVEEMVRAAAGKPYKEAASELSRTHHFNASPDTLQDIVEKMRAEATKFTWLSDLGPKEDAKRIMDTVYVLVDGTDLPFRRSSLKGAKGMFPLRTLEKSGRLDEFFNWRLRNLKQVICTKSA